MILKYFNPYHDRDKEENEYKSYKVSCPECNGNNLNDIDIETDWIDGLEIVTITLQCKDCGKTWLEEEYDLDISEYQ